MEGTTTTTYHRCIICPECSTTCLLCTSASAKNPGRQYYKCPSDSRFVKWADQVREKEWLDVPICSCKAGVCRVTKVMFGPDAGRTLFTCLIKEGHGSCGYRAWKDELEASKVSPTAENDQSSLKSTLTNSDLRTDPSCPSEQRLDNDADDELDFTYVDEIIQSLSLSASIDYDQGISLTDVNLVDDASKNPESLSNVIPISNDNSIVKSVQIEEMPTYELIDADASDDLQCVPVAYAKIERLRSHGKKYSKSSKRPLKRSRHAYQEDQTTLASWRSYKVCLDVKSVSAEDYCWMKAAISQNLSPQLKGWLGRLVFRPSLCLITSSNAINDMDDDFEALTTVNRGGTISCEKSAGILVYKPDESGPQSMTIASSSDDNVRESSISKVFAKAAEVLQNDLIALLETTDARDHRAMSQASEAAFAALDCMFFDHRGLKQRVNELIRRAKSLAEIELEGESRDVQLRSQHQRLVDCCSSKRVRLERFKNARAKAFDDMTKSKDCLSDLKNEMVSAKNWLFEIEAELSIFEVEMKGFEDGLEKLEKGTEVLERDYAETCEEVEESLKIVERRESVRNEARDAFERARMLLRGDLCSS